MTHLTLQFPLLQFPVSKHRLHEWFPDRLSLVVVRHFQLQASIHIQLQ